MEKRLNIFDILKLEGKLIKVLIYSARETEDDPYEHTKSLSFLNPITIKASVRNISTEALAWKYYGNIPIGSKELICEKKYKNSLLIADKIQIGSDFFKCYKDDQKGFGIIEKEDYLIVILELKPINA